VFAEIKPGQIDKIFAKSVKLFAKSVKLSTKYLHLDYPDDFDGDPLGEPQFPSTVDESRLDECSGTVAHEQT
jgi:hypothetical protein